METLKEEWEVTLDELETESAHLLEQLNGAGVELSSLYKWIEKQVPNGCCTETWKNTTHWAGTQMPSDVISSVAQAEEYLQTHRPVRRFIINLINRVDNFQPSPKRKDFFLAQHILTTFMGISSEIGGLKNFCPSPARFKLY